MIFKDDESGHYFHQVIALHEKNDLDWMVMSQEMPGLPRGWFELAHLPIEDRIEFTHHYWQTKLPFIDQVGAQLEKRLSDFFENMEDIGIYATQLRKGDPFDVHMVYTLKDEGGFFQGFPPASSEALALLQKRFGHIQFPPDYLSFLQIHDGFSKYTDTGLVKSKEMVQVYQRLQHLLSEEILIRPDGRIVDPQHLIPFYESFGLHSYQCFYADWYPKTEIGNVYFSEYDRSISNFLEGSHVEDNLAFSSFIEWLIFYLEDIWHL